MTKNIDTRAIMLALLLGCGGLVAPPLLAKTTKSTMAATAATSLRTTIEGHYARYRYVDNRDIPARYRAFQYSPALKALYDRLGGGLDYDEFCGCQEYEEDKFRYTILSTEINGRQADVYMQVFPFYNDDGRNIRIKFLRNVKGIWQVDDVIDDEHQSLQAMLRAMKPGSLRHD